MQRPSLLAAALTAISCTILSACSKNHDFCDPSQQEQNFCPIVSLESIDPANPGITTAHYIIDYNETGNPLDILHFAGVYYPEFDYHFRYDQSHRLTDKILNITGYNTAMNWDRYSYPAKNIIWDSVFNYGNSGITDPRPEAGSYSLTWIYTLDKEGRIIKAQVAGSPDYTIYQYDARGNLIRSGVTYDNKINPYQTNAVWKLIFKDYSVDNPSLGVSGFPSDVLEYNFIGLPVLMQGVTGGGGGINLFDHIFYTQLKLTYACNTGQK
ncbi:MAG TPA: hypothetical protein VL832_03060 [Puia sp.]|jgi:hypothetical protein|nr:hypothetical protein [Puia sp.]